MSPLLFTLEIDPVKRGVIYERLPRHCVLMPWFQTAMTPEHLLLGVHDVFRRHKPIELISTEPAMFGPRGNVPVHRYGAPTRSSSFTRTCS